MLPDENTKPESVDAEYLRILAENLESGVSILDSDMNYLFLSSSVYKNIKCTPEDLKAGDPLQKCHDLMMKNGLFTEEILKNQRLSSEEQMTRNASGQVETARLVTLGDGSTHRFVRKNLPCGKTVSIADNVSELVEKDKLFEKSLALGNAGYWSLDIATKTYTLSKSLHRYFGAELIDNIHRNGIISVVHPDDRVKFKTALASASKSGNRFDVTSRTPSHKNDERWSTTSGEIIRDVDGKAIRIEAFVKDVTRDKRQAAELETAKDEAIAASKAKSEFLANMSHEIRTPMNGILGMAELLSHSEISDRQKDFVSVINNSASALLTIINDILDFSKIEAGAFEMDPVPFDLKSSMNDVTSLLLSTAQDKGLELIINYPTDLPKGFIGDAGRLRQVMTNLVGNAIKFTEEGHICIDVDVKRSRDIAVCTVKVSDTGIGIPPEKLQHIFEKFTQADGSTTRVYGGTGLGLTISKYIIEMMGGRMQVASTVGQGSSFGFRVPLPLDPEAKAEHFDRSLVAHKRALIIDDIQVNRDLLSEQLSAWNIETETAIDGVDALTTIRASQESGQPFDFLILDFLMPGMNGQEFAQVLHQTSTLNAPQIIMLSSCDQPISTPALSAIGIDSYLVKPVRERRLFDTIVRTLSNPPARDETVDVVDEDVLKVPRKPQKQDILVAEDFALNRDVVKLMLADTEFQPIFAENGKQALDMFSAEPDRFDAVIMDVSMPEMDGYEATRRIREFERAQGRAPIPIIALTGHALKNDRQDCMDAGMDDYLTKPVKQGELIDTLENYTGKAIDIKRSA